MSTKPDLQTAIRQALAGATSQKPVCITELYRLGTRKQVKAAIQEMYNSREIGCCMVTRNSLIGGFLYCWPSAGRAA